MKTIGFVISGKENERRRAVLPQHLVQVRHRAALLFEENYATHFGIPDDVYRELGCQIAPKRDVYGCDIICNPKAPEPAERDLFNTGQTLFGWLHAVQGRVIVDFLLERQMTGIAWEDMFENGRHVFWRNNEIAGEAAVLHAVNYWGRLPLGFRAAIIGMGNCGRGAFRVLSQLGVACTVFDRKTVGSLSSQIGDFDIVVNSVCWDVFRNDHLISRADLGRMKRGSLIIDISCDEAMGIETSHPTPIYDPVYEVDGIIHYVVDHTPALFYVSATESIGSAVSPCLDQLVTGEHGQCVEKATIIKRGVILDDRITRYQGRAAACKSS